MRGADHGIARQGLAPAICFSVVSITSTREPVWAFHSSLNPRTAAAIAGSSTTTSRSFSPANPLTFLLAIQYHRDRIRQEEEREEKR